MKYDSDNWKIYDYKLHGGWQRRLKIETERLVRYSKILKRLRSDGLTDEEKGLDINIIILNYKRMIPELENYIWRIQVAYNEFRIVNKQLKLYYDKRRIR